MFVRCRACGWLNASGADICEKCGAAVRGGAVPPVSGAETAVPSEEAKKTVVIRSAGAPAAEGRSRRHCPNCGYPVWSNMPVCPQCKSPLQVQAADSPQPKAGGPSPEDLAELKKTYNPYLNSWNKVQGMDAPGLNLSVLPDKEGAPEEARFFPGDEIRIGEDGAQALFTADNGHWSVAPAEETGCVFVAMRGKTALQPGDIILVGGRRYRFESGERRS